ncbi:MAG: hypothetical protein LBM96_02315 [Methanobrevibacter sp.]|jgi:hypothetical protein|nr:hypothetical protein [Candidatus Methanoflexus mossambicus]
MQSRLVKNELENNNIDFKELDDEIIKLKSFDLEKLRKITHEFNEKINNKSQEEIAELINNFNEIDSIFTNLKFLIKLKKDELLIKTDFKSKGYTTREQRSAYVNLKISEYNDIFEKVKIKWNQFSTDRFILNNRYSQIKYHEEKTLHPLSPNIKSQSIFDIDNENDEDKDEFLEWIDKKVDIKISNIFTLNNVIIRDFDQIEYKMTITDDNGIKSIIFVDRPIIITENK